ncbi:MAG: site-2 protease family protein [Planctomycetota bacterium]
MLQLEPQPTDYDLNFQFLGFPVRVHPLFWLVALILGANGVWTPQGEVLPHAGAQLLSWTSVMFASILAHELGHALSMRYFRQSSRIVLYVMGGLTIPDSSHSSFSRPATHTRLSHILISLAGPGAGFSLATLTVLLIYTIGGEFRITPERFPFFYQPQFPAETNLSLRFVLHDLLFMNIFWGLLNLLPIFPLDGGQVSRQLFEHADPWNGLVRSLWLSIMTAGGIAIASWVYLGSRFMPLLFISLAASNYMMLQQMTGGRPGGGRW